MSTSETIKIIVEKITTPPVIEPVVEPVAEPLVEPVIEPIGNKKIQEGTPVQIVIKATDADSPPDTLTYSATPLPEGASFDPSTGVFNWVPTCADAGIHIVTFSCCDNGTPPLCATETVEITVTRTNSRPAIEPISDMRIHVNEPFVFTINATDPDTECDTLTYSAISLPDGASFDPDTRVFKWKPSDKDLGTNVVIFMCCDSTEPPLCDSKVVIINVY